MTDEEYFAEQDRRRTVASVRAKAERGERLTKAERVCVWSARMDELDTKLVPLLKAGRVRDAILEAMMVTAAHAVGNATFFDKLEDRISALEAIVKPRVRVQAPTRSA